MCRVYTYHIYHTDLGGGPEGCWLDLKEWCLEGGGGFSVFVQVGNLSPYRLVVDYGVKRYVHEFMALYSRLGKLVAGSGNVIFQATRLRRTAG